MLVKIFKETHVLWGTPLFGQGGYLPRNRVWLILVRNEMNQRRESRSLLLNNIYLEQGQGLKGSAASSCPNFPWLPPPGLRYNNTFAEHFHQSYRDRIKSSLNLFAFCWPFSFTSQRPHRNARVCVSRSPRREKDKEFTGSRSCSRRVKLLRYKWKFTFW